MTRDEVLALAREAKMFYQPQAGWIAELHHLERFAALVAAHERERICKQIAMLHDSLSLTGTANWGRK